MAHCRVERARGRVLLYLGPSLLAIVWLSALKGAVRRAGTPQGSPPSQPQLRGLLVIVLDENGVAIPSASLILTQGQTVLRGETNYAGRYEFARLPAGERHACERLWAEVRVLLARSDAGG